MSELLQWKSGTHFWIINTIIIHFQGILGPNKSVTCKSSENYIHHFTKQNNVQNMTKDTDRKIITEMILTAHLDIQAQWEYGKNSFNIPGGIEKTKKCIDSFMRHPWNFDIFETILYFWLLQNIPQHRWGNTLHK